MGRILAKIGLRDRVQAVVLACETGLAGSGAADGTESHRSSWLPPNWVLNGSHPPFTIRVICHREPRPGSGAGGGSAMSASQSFLASPSYGYDFVVATTQASINTIIRRFLHEVGEPQVTVCWVAGPRGAPQEIGYEELVSRANGSDPFAVSPDADPRTDPDLFNLTKAGFMMAFQAQIGIPPVTDPDLIKTLNYVTLGSTPNSVTYHLMCSQFDVTQLIQTGQGTMTWLVWMS